MLAGMCIRNVGSLFAAARLLAVGAWLWQAAGGSVALAVSPLAHTQPLAAEGFTGPEGFARGTTQEGAGFGGLAAAGSNYNPTVTIEA